MELCTGRPLGGVASYPTTVGRFSVDLRAVPTLVGPDQAGAPSLQFTGPIEVLVPFTTFKAKPRAGPRPVSRLPPAVARWSPMPDCPTVPLSHRPGDRGHLDP